MNLFKDINFVYCKYKKRRMEKENKLKTVLSSFFPISMFMRLKDIEMDDWKELGNTIFIIIAPLLIIFSMFNLILLVGSFVMWHWPDHFYLPFYGGNMQSAFDRLLLLIGILIAVFRKDL